MTFDIDISHPFFQPNAQQANPQSEKSKSSHYQPQEKTMRKFVDKICVGEDFMTFQCPICKTIKVFCFTEQSKCKNFQIQSQGQKHDFGRGDYF